MDLHEKLAQRRREREQEAALVQSETVYKQMAKSEVVQQEARKHLVDAGLQPFLSPDEAKAIQVEKDKILEKAASSRWTNTENIILLVLIGATIFAFFNSWTAGIFWIMATILYYRHINKIHKKRIEDEIVKYKLRDALRAHLGKNK